MTRFLLLLCVVACGPKSSPPTNPNIDRGKDIPRSPDLTASGTSVNLTCNAVTPGKCKTQSYTFAGSYELADSCTWRGTELVFRMKGTQNTDGLMLQISNFNGPGTYALAGQNDFVNLSANVTMAATSCSTEHIGTESARSPKATCGGCSVLVSDPNPNAAFPKALTAHISCPDLCNEDAYKCGPINLTLTNDQCSH